jgi:hypothetical protein
LIFAEDEVIDRHSMDMLGMDSDEIIELNAKGRAKRNELFEEAHYVILIAKSHSSLLKKNRDHRP